MNMIPPLPAASSAPAAWLASRIDLWAEQWVTGTVGPGFEAYARIFHPLDDGPDAPRWADVAAQHGRSMHASAQWGNIRSSSAPGDLMSNGRGYPGDPMDGNLNAEALGALCLLLADHTNTADECWFAVWDGWGWQQSGAQSVLQATRIGEEVRPIQFAGPEQQLDLSAPMFSLPGRDYHLYAGPIDVATRIGHWVTANCFDAQSPSIFWPTDHAWCVASEIDYDSTLVGGTRQLIADITSSPRLEALQIAPNAARDDTINV